MMDRLDWNEAEDYLEVCERNYTGAGSTGYLVLIHVLRPLRNRFNSGERSPELYEEIMETVL